MVGPSGVVSAGCVVSEFDVVDPAVVQSMLHRASLQKQFVASYER